MYTANLDDALALVAENAEIKKKMRLLE